MIRQRKCWHVLLLLACAASSLNELPSQQVSSSSSTSRAHSTSFLLGAAAQSVDDPPERQTADVVSAVGPIFIKPANATPADALAPARVGLRYRQPGQGPCGRWDNFDYRDDRNSNPARYCPRSCRVVSTQVARCQCVTRSSLNAFYSGRRWGTWSWPECCYLTPPNGGGGGCNSGCPPPTPSPPGPTPPPSPPPPSPNTAQNLRFQLYSIGSCTAGGLGLVESSIRGFIATLPGVVGSTVQVRASASIASMSEASSVVQASLNKTRRYNQQKQKQAATAPGGVVSQRTGKMVLPPQINVSSTFERAGDVCC